ncbi:hypothetical protein [Undibacterium pigrum]|uniref:Uncharacterized protein n=1 Tax=Undibacterium pigrum TaxID=401470 RepID=A0A318IMT0_9BURK|nr:hypothetical protein [Undibacterium pigrum]PXX33704.1 hypothetical protein DFR42_1308 [Undibacterium pigrum]
MQWRNHPALQAKLHPQHPDDLQVIVHDGGPRLTERKPELVWVSINGMDKDIFSGTVLNAPTQLQSISQHQQIQFALAGVEHPVLLTAKYLQEKAAWNIHACKQCGLSELFDAPSDLIKVIFPNIPADAQLEGFSSFCPLCHGVQLIESKVAPIEAEALPKRPWWKFWAN